MRPDSYNYTAIVFDQTEAEVMWTLIKQVGVWLDTVVQSGWSMVNFTGKDHGEDTAFFREVLGSVNPTWHPLAEIYNDGDGQSIPSDYFNANNSFAKSVYLRWEDDVETERNIGVFDYYLSTVHLYNGIAYDDLRVGCLLDAYNDIFFYGTQPNFMSYSPLNGWGPPPGPNEGPEGLYPYWPVQGSHDIPPAPTPDPDLSRSYNTQPGYIPNSERIGNYFTYGSDDSVTAHCFAGVDKGAPYLFIVLESTSPDFGGQVHYYHHCGIGNVVKSGHWKGGQWAVTTYNNSSDPHIDSLNSDYNTRMFDNITTRYAPSTARSLIYCSTDGVPYDSGDPDTRPEQFTFGPYPTNTINRAYGCTTGGLLTDALTNSGYNQMSYRTTLFPNYIRLLDPDNSNYYFLAGVVPCQRITRNELIQPGEEYTEGGVTWKVFPLRGRVGVPTNTPYSGFYAAAYRMN